MGKILKIKPYGYWTYEKVEEEAKKYNTRGEFQKRSQSAYVVAYNNKWLDNITNHMIEVKKPNGYWTYDRLEEEAKKYNTRGEFKKGNASAYLIVLKNIWLDDVTKHMTKRDIKPKGYWTYDKVEEEAKKYTLRKEFEKNNQSAYKVAYKNGWLPQITKHMTNDRVKEDRLIYSFEFSDKSVYVGLTKRDDLRYKQHTKYDKKCVVYNYVKETGLIPKFTKETNFLSEEDSVKMEEYVEDWYRQNGWKVLNIAKTGSLGGSLTKWTYDKVEEEAKKYNTKWEFQKGCCSAYSRSLQNGWVDGVTKHMEQVMKPSGYWTYEKVEEEAKKYNTRGEFQKGSRSAYSIAYNNKWLDNITDHMVQREIKPKGYWTYEKVEEEAKKYNTKGEFAKGSSRAYNKASQNGWIPDITKHIILYGR